MTSVGYGGAPAAAGAGPADRGAASPGARRRNGYGLTETSSVTTINGGADYERKPESVGVPVPVVDVKVVDPDGDDAAASGEVGELWIKGPNVVKGYWNKPEATAADLHRRLAAHRRPGPIDDEGFVYIVDRAKDMHDPRRRERLLRRGRERRCTSTRPSSTPP